MVCSNLNNKQLFDPFRNKWVVETPEEKVRQALLHKMVNHLGYPKSLIGVEKGLCSLTLSNLDRRIDIVCYCKRGQPLLLIECKAALPLTQVVENQLIGYNNVVKAPYLALANEQEVKMGFYDGKRWVFKLGFASYQQLVRT